MSQSNTPVYLISDQERINNIITNNVIGRTVVYKDNIFMFTFRNWQIKPNEVTGIQFSDDGMSFLVKENSIDHKHLDILKKQIQI